MYLKKVEGVRAVKLASGRIITQADLPPKDTCRWVASRKAVVVHAIDNGLISKDDAIDRWSLSDEELDEWMSALDNFGVSALKATNLQRYRQP